MSNVTEIQMREVRQALYYAVMRARALSVLEVIGAVDVKVGKNWIKWTLNKDFMREHPNLFVGKLDDRMKKIILTVLRKYNDVTKRGLDRETLKWACCLLSELSE